MMTTNLTSLTRAEIAQRGVKASLACYFLSLITMGLSWLLQSPLIFSLAVLMVVFIFSQSYFSKKVSANPFDQKNWNALRMSHWLFSIAVSLMLVSTVLHTEDTLNLVIMFSVLAGVAGHFLLVASLDRTLILPVLSFLHLPLMSIALVKYVSVNSNFNLLMLIIYFNCMVYSLIQYRFLHGQFTLNLKSRFELEKLNFELKNLDKKQDIFIQMVLTLLNNKVPLEKVFHSIIGFFENQNSGWICSILFLDKARKRFDQAYAPSIADFYNNAIKTLDIGPNAGSCGTAAFTGQRTIVENIQTDPLWNPYRELAAAADLAACWSQPIKDKNNQVIGTYAIYHRSPHAPSEHDIRMIEQAAELVAIVLHHFEAEELIRKTQEDLSLIYNSSIDTMWLIGIEENDNYRFISINDAFEKSTGFKRENVINKRIEEVLPPQILESTKARYDEVKASGQVIDYLDVAVFPTGPKAGQIRLKPIFDDSGVCTKILGIVEDITEKQRIDSLLTERETALMYAQKVARLGNWRWDLTNPENTVTSKEVTEMLELESNPVSPFSIDEVTLFTDDSWNRAKPVVENAIANGIPYEIDLERKMSNGQHRWFTARGEVISRDANGNPTMLAGTMQDITDRKVLENNLKAALQSRDEFIAVASHELKTPLTTIQLSLHSIRKSLETNNSEASEQIRPKLARANSQSERLAALIDNLLDVTRMGSGKIHMDFQPGTNLSELTETVLKKYEEELAKSGSTLTKEIDPQILGSWDKGRLEQVVTNLLSNAIKYGAGKPIEVSLRQSNQQAILVMRDHGIGIPTAKQPKIFDRFERAVNETNYQGLGLGLWIVNEIVKAHKGSARVEDAPDEGTIFTVTIPLSGGSNE